MSTDRPLTKIITVAADILYWGSIVAIVIGIVYTLMHIEPYF